MYPRRTHFLYYYCLWASKFHSTFPQHSISEDISILRKLVISILGKGSFKFRIIRLFYMIIRIKKQEFVIFRKTKPLVEDPTFVAVHCNKTKSKDFCQSDSCPTVHQNT